MVAVLVVSALVCAGMACDVRAAASGPGRLMPFLCRDAVVRESGETRVLVGAHVRPTVCIGRASAGPRAPFDDKQIRKAAGTLATYVEHITGVRLEPVPSGVASPESPRVFIHAEGSTESTFPELTQADAHGFAIASRGEDLHIVGGSAVGTLYGVWFFLQNYCGLRIVMPGELGEVYERRDAIEIPVDLYVLNPGPDFLLRIHSLNNGFDGSAWLADFGGSQRFQYHHNCWRIYPPETYGRTHPEYFPVVGGKRFIPPAGVRSGWQPTFSEPSVVARAVEFADEQFRANPELKSISLMPNDGRMVVSEIDLEKAEAEGKPPTQIYFEFVNAVACEVKTRWPDRYVAFISYQDLREPPDIPLEDNCMVFAMEFAGNPHQVLEKWEDKVRHFGIYQWIYGNSFVVPNHWPHAVQDYLKLVRRYGTNALKTEFYDAYAHGGARLWVLSNLLWNTDADVDALLTDYFEHMYGREAAPAMARYWSQWEQVYERRRTPTEFNLCLFPGKERQFEHIRDEDMSTMSQALRDAAQKVVGESNRERLDMVARLFENSRRYYEMWQALRVLREYPEEGTSLEEAGARLRGAAAFLEAEEAVFDWRYRKIEPAAMYCAVLGKPVPNRPWLPNYLQMDPRLLYVYGDGKWVDVDSTINRIARTISSARGAGQAGAAVAAWWEEQAAQRPVLRAVAESERLRLLQPAAALTNLLPNGSLEAVGDPQSPAARQLQDDLRTLRANWVDADHCTILDPVCEGWNALENRCYQRTEVTLDRTVKHHGAAALRIKAGGQFGGVITRTVLPLAHRRYRLSFWYRGSGAGYGLMLERLRHLPYLDKRLPPASEWTRFEVEFPFNWRLMPDETGSMTVWLGLMHAQSEVWFDEVRLEMLGRE